MRTRNSKSRFFLMLSIHLVALAMVVSSMQGCGGSGGPAASATNASVVTAEATPGNAQGNTPGTGNNSSGVVDTAVVPISNPSFDLTQLNGTYGFKINGVRGSDSPGFSDELGSAVANVGDLDGDGKNEIFVSASAAEDIALSQSFNSGRGYVLFGTTSAAFAALANGTNGFSVGLINGTNGIIINKSLQTSQLGQHIGGGGDFNGDGLSDLIISEQVSSGLSSSYLLYGDKNTGDGKSFRQFNAVNVLSLTGFSDLNADGRDDGSIFGGFSSADGVIPLNANNAGDIDNDGKDDILVGFANRSANSGETFLVFGASESSLDTHSTLTADGSNVISFKGKPGDFSGKSVNGIGDINHDGIADFAIAGTSAGLDGKIFVIFGNSNRSQLQALATTISSLGFQSALNGSNGFTVLNGPFSNLPSIQTQMGDNVTGLGDFNGDGIDDFAFSLPILGITEIIYGRSGGFSSTLDAEAAAQNSSFGIGIAAGTSVISSAGDVNNDGKKDLLIGAAGRAFVLFGRSNLHKFVTEPAAFAGYNQKFIDLTEGQSYSAGGGLLMPGQSLNGLGIRFDGPANTAFATSVSGLGDINGDGFDDIIIGDKMGRPATVVQNAFNSNKAGQAFVFFGRQFN